MTSALTPFAAVQDMISQGVTRHLANATVQLQLGGPAWAAMYERRLLEASACAEVATVSAHTITLHLSSALGGLAEGARIVVITSAWPAGQLCRITTAVEPDESGWATFDVMPTA